MSTIDVKQHSAEHILAGVFGMLFQGAITDTRFKGKKVRCDFRVTLDISVEEAVKQAEDKANEIISEHRSVVFEEVSRDEAIRICTTHIGKVPENIENIRLVKIGEDIITACIGKHVTNTNEIGTLRINTVHQIELDLIRLTFVLESVASDQK